MNGVSHKMMGPVALDADVQIHAYTCNFNTESTWQVEMAYQIHADHKSQSNSQSNTVSFPIHFDVDGQIEYCDSSSAICFSGNVNDNQMTLTTTSSVLEYAATGRIQPGALECEAEN